MKKFWAGYFTSLFIAATIVASLIYFMPNEVTGGDYYCVCGAHYLIIVDDGDISVNRVVEEDEVEIPSIEL